MMKPIVIILLLLGCTFSAFAADKVTPEFNNLQVIRAKKIQEIDTAYVKALEKLKLKCTKKGDLVSANAINDELMAMGKQDNKEKSEQATSISTDKLPEDTKTLKVPEGVIAYIEPERGISFPKAMKLAEEYGGEIYCPTENKGIRQILRLLPTGKRCWLNVQSQLDEDEIVMETPDGLEFDYDKITKLEHSPNMSGLNEHKPCKLLINANARTGKKVLDSYREFIVIEGFILLLPEQ